MIHNMEVNPEKMLRLRNMSRKYNIRALRGCDSACSATKHAYCRPQSTQEGVSEVRYKRENRRPRGEVSLMRVAPGRQRVHDPVRFRPLERGHQLRLDAI